MTDEISGTLKELQELDLEQTVSYIRHRIEHFGGSKEAFSDDALREGLVACEEPAEAFRILTEWRGPDSTG